MQLKSSSSRFVWTSPTARTTTISNCESVLRNPELPLHDPRHTNRSVNRTICGNKGHKHHKNRRRLKGPKLGRTLHTERECGYSCHRYIARFTIAHTKGRGKIYQAHKPVYHKERPDDGCKSKGQPEALRKAHGIHSRLQPPADTKQNNTAPGETTQAQYNKIITASQTLQ